MARNAMTMKGVRSTSSMSRIMSSLLEYAESSLPGMWTNNLKLLVRRREENELCERMFEQKLASLADDLTEQERRKISNQLTCDFELGACSLSRHFIARIFSRFYRSNVEFVFARVRALIRSCRKNHRERSEKDGMMLVMDYRKGELLTIFVR